MYVVPALLLTHFCNIQAGFYGQIVTTPTLTEKHVAR